MKLRETLFQADPRLSYPWDVVEGRVVAGVHVVMACQRFIRDLESDKWTFDLNALVQMIQRFDAMPLPGQQARPRFEMLPWQVFVIANLYGFYESDGSRRFRRMFLQTARGSGKSPLVSAICIQELIRPKALIVLTAATREQSLGPFRYTMAMIQEMVERDDFNVEPRIRGGQDDPREVIWGKGADAGRYLRFSGSTKDGKGKAGFTPTCVVLEEYQEVADDSAFVRLVSGIKDARDPFVLVVGNAGFGVGNPAHEQYKHALAVVSGEVELDSMFVMSFAVDTNDDPANDESCWIKANPSIDVGAPPYRTLRDSVALAKTNPSLWSDTERAHFSRWQATENPSIRPAEWDPCIVARLSSPEDRAKRHGFIGVDLAKTRDLTSVAIVWDFDDHIEAEVLSFTPIATIDERAREDSKPYRSWMDRGHLIGTDSGTGMVDHGVVAAYIERYLDDYAIKLLTYDRYFWTVMEALFKLRGIKVHTEKYLQRESRGLWCVETPQSYTVNSPRPNDDLDDHFKLWLPGSWLFFEKQMVEQKLQVLHNEPLNVAALSAEFKSDESGNVIPDRSSATKLRVRQDPLVALIMAVGALGQYRRLRRK